MRNNSKVKYRSYESICKAELRPYMIKLWVSAILSVSLLLYAVTLPITGASVCFIASLGFAILAGYFFKAMEKKGFAFNTRAWNEFLGEEADN